MLTSDLTSDKPQSCVNAVASSRLLDAITFQRLFDECFYPRQKLTCCGLLSTPRRKAWFSVVVFLLTFEFLFSMTLSTVMRDAQTASARYSLQAIPSSTVLDIQEAFSADPPSEASAAVQAMLGAHVPPLRRPTERVFYHKVDRPNYWMENLFKWTSMTKYMWKQGITDEMIEEEAVAFAKYAKSVVGSVPPPELAYVPESEGIVTSLIGSQDSLSVAHLLYHIYALNGTLPIELWIERRDSTPGVRMLASRLFPDGMLTLRELEDVQGSVEKLVGPLEKAPGKQKKFYVKTQALVASRFQHVLWLDVDAFLLKDARSLMKELRAQNRSAVFWHDSYGIWYKNPIWKILNRTKNPYMGPACETGLYYIDKSRTWDSILLAARMNQKQKLYSTLLWGDKDTLFLAMDYFHHPYAWAPYVPYYAGRGKSIFSFKGLVLVQPDFDGKPLAVHFVSGKKFLPREVINRQDSKSMSAAGAGKRHRLFTEVIRYDPHKAHVITSPFRSKRFTVLPNGFHPKIAYLPFGRVISNFEDTFYSYSNIAHALCGQFKLRKKNP